MESKSNPQQPPPQPLDDQHHPPKKNKINHPMEEEEKHPSSSSSSPNQEPEPLIIFPNFPHELLIEIISRLPVKSLVKFKCVSRTWFSLISNPHFIKTHLINSSKKDDFGHHGLILTVLPPNSHSHLKQCSVESTLDVAATTTSEVTEIDYPMKNPYKSVWVVGSCDGLVCIAIEEDDLFLWNPSIRKSKKLPDLGVKIKHGCYMIFGFGYDNLNDDYKVVGVFCVFCGGNVYETEVRVYSLKSDAWKRIEDFKGGVLLDDSGKYANGKLHWASSHGFDSNPSWKIISLDLGSETYGEVERPEYGDGLYDWTFGVLGGCLSVLFDYERTRADVWVMKEYGVRDSWSKVVSVPYLGDPEKSRYSMPVCLLRNGEILLVFGSGLAVYNPKSSAFRYPQVNGLEEVNMYVQSLVSPNIHDGEQRQEQ
ncbi:hypothetical protein ACH5RR_032737 [Cinchona calisaya]|uniref:F-box domain-containing protein n=1 Tax=Cinchona calisaya TaxID=153742 RepID=A0ABD2YN44_9GENT